MKKSFFAAGAGALLMLGSALSASAHDAGEVRHLLRDQGFYNIHFYGSYPPKFQVNACRDGERYDIHVNYYGKVTKCEPIGYCGRKHFSHRKFRDYDAY